MKTKISPFAVVISMLVLMGVAILMIGCGSSSSSSSNLTQAQAQQVATTVSNGIRQELTGAFGVAANTATVDPMRRDGVAPSLSSVNCTTTPSGQSCTLPISGTYTCPGGGTMGVSGNISGTLSNTGSGSVQAQIAATPTNCSVDGLVINGDPNVKVSTQASISNWNPVWPLSATETGAVTYGPNPSGTCQLNVSVSINSNLSCTVSGTACGQSVSGSC